MSHFIINGILYEMLIGIVKCIARSLKHTEKMDKSINDNRWCSTYPKWQHICLLTILIMLFTISKEGEKIERYDKNVKEQADLKTISSELKIRIPKDKSKVAGYIEIPDADKEPVYPGPATPEQLNRGVSFAEENESLDDQNISIAGHTFIDRPNYQFTNLKAAKKGSMVYFKVGNETRKYKMTSIRDVKPTDVEVLDERKGKDKQLTLITCDDYNEKTGISGKT